MKKREKLKLAGLISLVITSIIGVSFSSYAWFVRNQKVNNLVTTTGDIAISSLTLSFTKFELGTEDSSGNVLVNYDDQLSHGTYRNATITHTQSSETTSVESYVGTASTDTVATTAITSSTTVFSLGLYDPYAREVYKDKISDFKSRLLIKVDFVIENSYEHPYDVTLSVSKNVALVTTNELNNYISFSPFLTSGITNIADITGTDAFKQIYVASYDWDLTGNVLSFASGATSLDLISLTKVSNTTTTFSYYLYCDYIKANIDADYGNIDLTTFQDLVGNYKFELNAKQSEEWN
ncbi:MAG: hypothetical protein WCR97_02320 [Bacilli bacterium]